MNGKWPNRSLIIVILFAVVWGIGVRADAGLFGFGRDSWQEEVLLHDGSKMVITRSQTYGGSHEIGQPSPIKEHTISFTLPGSSKRITWTSEYGDDLGRTNFYLLAVQVLNGTPYIVAEPNLCLSYNKWGRPNPPYVFFRYDSKAWQRIPLEDVPAEFQSINVALDILGREVENLVRLGFVSSEQINRMNRHIVSPQYKSILREPMKEHGQSQCGEMIYAGKEGGGWIGLGWFRDQPSYSACSKSCESWHVPVERCPCATLFKEKGE
ncbi:MAG: hypothetical protein H8K04_05525 [Nitrospira sp.]